MKCFRQIGNKYRGFTVGLCLLLAGMYALGSPSIDLLHHFVHKHSHDVSHSVTDENDSCHRFIYHHDVAQGCGHDSHVVVSDPCPWCDLALQRDQITFEQPDLSAVPSDSRCFSHYKLSLDGYQACISSSRAPPHLV